MTDNDTTGLGRDRGSLTDARLSRLEAWAWGGTPPTSVSGWTARVEEATPPAPRATADLSDRLRDALKPFAVSSDSFTQFPPPGLVDGNLYVAIKNEGEGTGWSYRATHALVSDLHRARAALDGWPSSTRAGITGRKKLCYTYCGDDLCTCRNRELTQEESRLVVGALLASTTEVSPDGLRDALGEPHCWVVPGRDTASDSGTVDANCVEQGEMTRPLWSFEAIQSAFATLNIPTPETPSPTETETCPVCEGTQIDLSDPLLTDPQPSTPPADTQPLGRFAHHPDPAIDFCIEVEVIEGLHYDHKVGANDGVELAQRVARAMTFRVGGDEIAVRAKHALRGVEAALRSHKTSEPAGPSGSVGEELMLAENPLACRQATDPGGPGSIAAARALEAVRTTLPALTPPREDLT